MEQPVGRSYWCTVSFRAKLKVLLPHAPASGSSNEALQTCQGQHALSPPTKI